MFKRSFGHKDRAGKATKPMKRSFNKDDAKLKLMEQLAQPTSPPVAAQASPRLNSPIITIVVGKDQRLFAAHEDVLNASPFFHFAGVENIFSGASSRRIHLPEEEAEVFSAVLEFLYKGDYFPRLVHDRRRNTWVLESADDIAQSPRFQSTGRGNADTVTVHHSRVAGGLVLRDTAIYCLAERFGLEDLKRLALRKQGLQSGIEVATILRSARFAYDNTPETDSRLRAHYLALIIRSRNTFKRSGTMQLEMESGSRMFFDLFVAMANHIDDLTELKGARPSPRVF